MNALVSFIFIRLRKAGAVQIRFSARTGGTFIFDVYLALKVYFVFDMLYGDNLIKTCHNANDPNFAFDAVWRHNPYSLLKYMAAIDSLTIISHEMMSLTQHKQKVRAHCCVIDVVIQFGVRCGVTS